MTRGIRLVVLQVFSGYVISCLIFLFCFFLFFFFFVVAAAKTQFVVLSAAAAAANPTAL